MHAIEIPNTVEEYSAQVAERALPDEMLRNHDYYKRLAGWVMDVRTPLLYKQDHDDEYTNFSINFNWLMLRDYSHTTLGPTDTVATMYALHEMTHMTHRLSTRLDTMTAEEYAEEFTASEYRASNETELLIHYRVPELRGLVFQGTKIAVDILRERNIPQPPSALLQELRPIVVEHAALDSFFSASDDDKAILARYKSYNNNREWATERFSLIKPYFSGPEFPQSSGLSAKEYETAICAYEPNPDQARYEANVMRNVRFGFAMCGLAQPNIKTFQEARAAAVELEGQHAIVQS